ncbi:MAG TPA: MBL fold metallo-hydrolase [Candidatus Eisenbacteria bacterium]|nr:MBL fold metallo-hydrolase [Candidatus Eisenbacteria bacterium]
MLSFENGIHVLGTGLRLDPRRRQPRAIVSHAHADHVARHKRWVTTPATAALCARRWEAADLEVHDFDTPWSEGPASFTLLPAGHILGSAMVLVEIDGLRVLYTGDFRLRASATAEPCRPVEADVLVMECTFGEPRYRFPDRAAALDELCDFIEHTLARDGTPVLLAYALGKAQEIARLLGDRGYGVALHASAWEMLEVYREMGVRFEHCEPYALGPVRRGVLIVPPHLARSPMVRRLPRRRIAFLSGWAMGPPDRARIPWDTAIPISDHADYGELLEMVERVRPERIYTLHGPESFATRLRARGHDARAATRETVDAGWQLPLFR